MLFVGFLDRAVWTGDGRTVLSQEEQKDMMKRGNRTHEGVFPPFFPHAKVNLVHYVNWTRGGKCVVVL